MHESDKIMLIIQNNFNKTFTFYLEFIKMVIQGMLNNSILKKRLFYCKSLKKQSLLRYLLDNKWGTPLGIGG
ncbi:hypothetical protein GCM10011414_26930 [Croceivirga lutea]|nr:hypothetical protein GCM10011414_26930 [Croceivirga lutea]